jgi:hypothetical protein
MDASPRVTHDADIRMSQLALRRNDNFVTPYLQVAACQYVVFKNLVCENKNDYNAVSSQGSKGPLCIETHL